MLNELINSIYLLPYEQEFINVRCIKVFLNKKDLEILAGETREESNWSKYALLLQATDLSVPNLVYSFICHLVPVVEIQCFVDDSLSHFKLEENL